MKLLLWLREKDALVRHLDDAHRALRSAHHNVRVLQQQVADLQRDVAEADEVSTCAGRGEHIRLARALEVAAARASGAMNVVPLKPVSVDGLNPRGGGVA